MNQKVYRNVLQAGYMLHWYKVGNVLGRGAFGVTYLAWDSNLKQAVAIKEYFPSDFSSRDNGQSVQPTLGSNKEIFDWGLDRFIREAQLLAQFKHQNIVRVMSVFELNNTAYMVMEYEQGEELSHYYKRNKNIAEQDLLDIFLPIMDGLKLVHESGIIHRDIKPANIYLREDTSAVLIDFGAARKSNGSATKTITSLVTVGYAPFEQYSESSESDEKQGAWTDIYALGACLYSAVTGKLPPDALARGASLLSSHNDPYEPLSERNLGQYTKGFLSAIDHALSFHTYDRPQDTQRWSDMLSGTVAAPSIDVRRERRPKLKTVLSQRTKASTLKRNRFRWKLIIRVIVLVLVVSPVSVGLFVYFQPEGELAVIIQKLALQTINRESGAKSIDKADATTDNKEESNTLTSLPPPPANPPEVVNTDPKVDKIKELLQQARIDYNAGRYTRPQYQNALLSFRLVQKIDPENQDAQLGIDAILQYYINLAKKHLNKKDSIRAERNIDGVLIVDPDSKMVAVLRAELNRLKEELRRGKYQASQISKAKVAFAAGNILSPTNNNALSLYHGVLKVEKQHKDAIKGIKKIEAYLTTTFNKNLSSKNYPAAKAILDSTKTRLPHSKILKPMQLKWNQKKAVSSKSDMANVIDIVGRFKQGIETRDLRLLQSVSELSSKRKIFLSKLFDPSLSYRLEISDVKYIGHEQQGSASIAIVSVVSRGDAVVPADILMPFKILIRRNTQGQWKIIW